MSSCTVRRGFLTLRACGEPASARCSRCGRPTCAAHLVADADQGPGQVPPAAVSGGTGTGGAGPAGARTGPLCAECSASQIAADRSVSDDAWAPTDSWRFGYRDSYYRESGYRPPIGVAGPADGFRTGGALLAAVGAPSSGDGPDAGFRTGGTFDDADREAFDPVLAEAGVLLEEDAAPDLFDS